MRSRTRPVSPRPSFRPATWPPGTTSASSSRTARSTRASPARGRAAGSRAARTGRAESDEAAEEPHVREGSRAAPGDRLGARGPGEGPRALARALRGGRRALALLPVADRGDPETRLGRPEV